MQDVGPYSYCKILALEQKGVLPGSHGSKNQLMIDKVVGWIVKQGEQI